MSFPDLGTAIRSILLADEDIVAIVGNRVYTDHPPQKLTIPAIVFWVISGIEVDDMAGPLGFSTERVQVDSYGVTRTVATQLSRTARATLAGYRGDSDGVRIRSITQATGQQYLTDRPAVGSDSYRPITSQDFFVHYLSNAKV